MKKRLLSLLLVLCMVLTLVPTTAFAVEEKGQTPSINNPFTDVKEGDWCYDAVQYARMNGFFNGTSKTKFTPNGTMTRGMFVTVLGRMAGVDTSEYEGESAFSDVPARKYYAPYVAWAAKHGITGGTGDGKFSPDALINRQQMATFFVRYFETFGVNFETGANITTVPADLDSVSSYAKDAVQKLWKQGLLNGDGKNFNPTGNATRAQAATLCMRTDKAVEVWYKEPGVPSDRVKIDPATGESTQPDVPKLPDIPSFEDATIYYKVTVHCNGTTEERYEPRGTLLNSITPPAMDNNKIFLGWYHDSGLTKLVGADEVLREDIDLYAKTGAVSDLEESGKPSFIARMDVTDTFASRFTVDVKWNDGSSAPIIPGVIKDGSVYPANANVVFRNITHPLRTDGHESAADLEPDEFISISGGVIRGTALYNPGSTYQIELLDENLIFDERMDNGDPADEYVRYFNFSVKKAEVINLDLNPDMLYIPAGELNETDRKNAMEYVGLYRVTYDPATGETTYTPNSGTGSFSYNGSFKDVIDEGDTVAIYQGNVRPDRRDMNDTGEVVYLTITDIIGTTYYYVAADHEDVLFTPDILPIDTDGDDCGVVSNAGGTLVIHSGKLDFSEGYSAIGLDAGTTVDVGDFLFFYTGDYGTGAPAGYGLITAVDIGAETATIAYTSVTETTVLKSMEMFVEEEPTKEQLMEGIDEQAIRESVTAQIMESGFVAETGAYLAEMALRTDEVQSVLGKDVTLEDVTIALPDGSAVSGDELELMDGNLLHKGENVKLDIAITLKLTHFEGASGVRVEVSVGYEFDIQKKGSDKKINVSLTAFFEQEIKLGVSVSGEAVWKKAWIIPYIADYQLSANMDLGSYTGVGITAVAKTDADKSDSGMPWPKTANEKEGTKKIYELTSAIKKEMEETKGLFKEGENSASGELADKYADMLEEAEDSWIDLFVVNIYEKYESVAPYYVLAYAIKVDFVVSANLYVALGTTFQYEASKRYSFAILVEASEAGSDVVETGTNGFRFDAYVMGTMGLKAGIRVKVLAGLFTCKLDGIGVQAEAGAYIQLWGYFYFSYSNYRDITAEPPVWEDKKEFTGALLIEIGAYLDVNFVAEVLDGKYAWMPSLYSNTWPLLQIGEPENVNDFAYEENDSTLLVEVLEKNTVTIPTSFFDMKYMDLTSGEQHGEKNDDGTWKTNKKGDELAAKNFDSNKIGADGVDDEERFYITMNNDRFTYDPTTNTVIINTAGTVEEVCEMTITWAGNPLAFTNNVPSRTVTIDWSNPEGIRYIQFDSTGGSSVKMARGPERGKITWPADPTKTGYTFGGWYYDEACTRTFDGSKTQLPENFGTNPDGSIIKGITLYAKWTPAPNRITVEYYQQGLNNRYELKESVVFTSVGSTAVKTDDTVAFTGLVKSYSGFTHDAERDVASHATVQADGSTLLKIYYSRNKYDVTFDVNYPKDAGITGINVVNSIFFDGDVAAAKSLCPGYDFVGWYTAASGGSEYTFGKMPARNVTVYAHWTPAADTPYTVAHYKQAATGGYVLEETESMNGTTGTRTEAAAKDYEGFTAQAIEQKNIAADGSTNIICRYDRNTYTLKLNYNDKGADSTVKTEEVMFEATMKPEDPVREGHEFSYWVYADAEGNETDRVFDPADTMPGADVTLIAKWDVQSYTLKYDLDGGKIGESSTVEDATYPYSETVKALQTPVRTGYTFKGWFEQVTETETKTYSAGEEFSMPARHMALKAQWEANTYTVTYHANSDEEISGKMDPSTFTYDDETTVLRKNDYTKVGHTFKGWATESGGAVVYADKAAVTENLATGEPGSANVDLYAVWQINKYTITFKNHDGTTVEVVEQDYKTTVTAPELTRTGYTFAGWFRGDSKYEVGSMPAESFTVFAKWTANDGIAYRINVYRQNADGSWPGDGQPTLISSETGTADSTVTITEGLFDEAGFTYDSDNAKNVTGGTVAVDGSLTLKLYYTRNKYDFTVDYADGSTPSSTTVYYGADIAAPADPTRTGYTFSGWDKSFGGSTMPDKDVTYTAEWTANKYTVNFNVNGDEATCGTASSSLTYDQAYGTLPVPTRTGHEFDGWFTQAEGGVEVTASTKMITASEHTLYAHWTIKQYTIAFENTGASSIDPIKQNYGTAVDIPASLEWPDSGYEFDGWDTELPATMPAYDMTITAQWKKIPYTITYELDGGRVVGGINPTAYNVETADFTLVNPIRDGYAFIGWKLEGTNVTVKDVTIEKGSIGNRIYVAQWELAEYTIEYKNIDGAEWLGTKPATTYTVEQAVTIPAMSKIGYIFDGWTGTGLPSKSDSVTIPVSSTGDRVYTANWTPISYTIRFEGGSEATGGTESVRMYYDSTQTLPANGFNRTGYSFLGWSTSPDGTDVDYADEASVNSNLSEIDDDTITLYAVWQANYYQVNFASRVDWSMIGDTDVTMETYQSYNEYDSIISFTSTPGPNFDFTGLYVNETWHDAADVDIKRNGDEVTVDIELIEANGFKLDGNDFIYSVYSHKDYTAEAFKYDVKITYWTESWCGKEIWWVVHWSNGTETYAAPSQHNTDLSSDKQSFTFTSPGEGYYPVSIHFKLNKKISNTLRWIVEVTDPGGNTKQLNNASVNDPSGGEYHERSVSYQNVPHTRTKIPNITVYEDMQFQILMMGANKNTLAANGFSIVDSNGNSIPGISMSDGYVKIDADTFSGTHTVYVNYNGHRVQSFVVTKGSWD